MSKYPFIACSLSFIIGILLEHLILLESITLLFAGLICCVLILFFYFIKKDKKLKIPILFAIIPLFVIIGSFLHSLQLTNKSLNQFAYRKSESAAVIGKVKSIDLINDDNLTFYLEADSIRIKNNYQRSRLLLMCKVVDKFRDLKNLYNRLKPGNVVHIEGNLMKGKAASNPGEFDYQEYLESKNINGIIYIKDEYEVKIINPGSDLIQSLTFNMRKAIDLQLSSLQNSQSHGLLRGLLLADKKKIDYETKTEFINSGVMHILAVSGLHVGYIALIFIIVFGRFNIYFRSIVIILGLLFFLIITGSPASVFRAVTMAVVIIISVLTNRSTNIFNSLAIAALIILALNTKELFNPGFQLSFAAVLSIASIYPFFNKLVFNSKIKSKIIKFVLLFMAVSLSAQIGTLPLTLMYFGKLSLAALLTNLIIIPLAGFIVGIAIFKLVLSPFAYAIASLYASVNDILIYVMFQVISFTGKSSHSYLPFYNYSLFDALVFYSTILLLIIGLKKFHSTIGKIVFSFLIILNGYIYGSFDNNSFFAKNKLTLIPIQLERGNAELFSLPSGKILLVNAGFASKYYDEGSRILMPLFSYLELPAIDYVLLTSLRSENYTGLISLVRAGLVRNIILPKVNDRLEIDSILKNFLLKNDVQIKYFQSDPILLDGVRIYPIHNDARSNIFEEAMLKIIFGKNSFLIVNANNFYLDNENIRQNSFFNSDVVILSDIDPVNFNLMDFLKYLKPEICIVKNSEANFNDSALNEIAKPDNKGVKIFFTGIEGTIILKFDGYKIKKLK